MVDTSPSPIMDKVTMIVAAVKKFAMKPIANHPLWMWILSVLGLVYVYMLFAGVLRLIPSAPQLRSSQLFSRFQPTYAPTPTPTPRLRPTGPGFFACDSQGICNKFSDEKRKSCTTTFADPECLGQCDDLQKRCK